MAFSSSLSNKVARPYSGMPPANDWSAALQRVPQIGVETSNAITICCRGNALTRMGRPMRREIQREKNGQTEDRE